MRQISLALLAAAVSATAAAAQTAGTLTCQFNQRGHDCNPTRCQPSTMPSGGKFRFDLAAKTMCVVRADECVMVGTFGAFHQDAASGAIMIFIGDSRGAMALRIDKDLFMVASTTAPPLSVSVYGGKCER